MIKFKSVSVDTISGQFLLLANSALTRCEDVLAKLGFVEVKSSSPKVAVSLLPLNKIDSSATSTMTHSSIRNALKSCRGVFVCLGVFSGVINILMLTGSFFMLQIYDRVLPSQSVPTLVGLAILATVLYVLQGALELIRNRVSVRIGAHLDQTLSSRVYDALVRLPLKTRGDGDGLQPLRDLDYVRSFLSGGGPAAFFDLPWLPIYLGICFLFHFWIGVTALAGSLVLIVLALLTEFRMREPTKEAARFATTRTALAAAGRRNAEVLLAMGMGRRVGNRWSATNRDYLAANERASDVASGLGGISKIFRTILQSAVLGVGAYLVIHQESTAGIIIASSILTSRALAPVEMAIANWKGFVAARQGAQRLHQLLVLLPAEQEPMRLPQPKSILSVERVVVLPPGNDKPVVNDISFELKSGQGLGIIGPSGSGKSSLARSLVGVWQLARGSVRLDRAQLNQWSSEALGQHIGYLPQDVELFDGTVASNIARLDPAADPEAIILAAQAAGVHELILALPAGYETRIGELGMAISAGQRQRIALARALFGNPFLVILDEPSSNLDAEGEEALTQAILNVRARGGIPIVIAHRPSALAGVDHVLVMCDGKLQTFGAKDEVLSKVLRFPTPSSPPARMSVNAQENVG
jgi:PrtD family type I secretion system ABC transporter